MCISIALENAAQGASWIWGAPTHEQSRIGFEEARRAAVGAAKFNEVKRSVTFHHGGSVRFFSLEKSDNIRGHTADGVVIDEIQSVKPAAYYEVVRPMLMDTVGEFWGVGSSNGHDWFWEEREAAKEMPDAISWNAPTLGAGIDGNGELIRQPHKLENPFIPFEEIKQMFRTLPRHSFRREVLADDNAMPGGIIYDVWLDGHPERTDGNVTEFAEYEPGAGAIFWGIDDGYAGEYDQITGRYKAGSHPRSISLFQLRPDGRLCMFDEVLRVKTQPEEHIREVLDLGYPLPDYAAVDKSAAALRGRLHEMGIDTRKSPATVDESIKIMREWVGPDSNGWRRLLVHPRCRHFRHEVVSYVYDGEKNKPVKDFDHTLDGCRYLIWTLRHE